MAPFDGFPRDVRATPLPDPFFNSLLEEIEDAAELKVTLRAVWLLGQKRGRFPTLTEAELLNDPTLLKGVKALGGGNPQERVRQGLEQAVTRKTLLRCPANLLNPSNPANSPNQLNQSNPAGLEKPFYLLNTESNRRELARRRAGLGTGTGTGRQFTRPELVEDAPEPPADARPNIYVLYEDNIGTIGVMLAEELKEAEERYPQPWIAEAFRIAVRENKRSWSYISAILRRWASEGRGGFRERAAAPGTAPGVGANAGATLWEMDAAEEVEDGEPGRYTPARNRQRPPEHYQRR